MTPARFVPIIARAALLLREHDRGRAIRIAPRNPGA